MNRKDQEKLHQQITALISLRPDFRARGEEALTALAIGALDRVKALLRELARSVPGFAATREDVLASAAVEAALGWAEMLELNYLDAAAHFQQACQILPSSARDHWRNYTGAQAEANYRQGQQHGDLGALRRAIRLRQEMLNRTSRRDLPMQWVALQNEMGNALLALGERETRPRALKQAAKTFKTALDAWPPDQAPLDRVMLHTKLGVALMRLAEREGSRRRLEKASQEFQAALVQYPRQQMPLGWASLQHYLGLALLRLAQHESGTLRVRDAIIAFRAALEERTRERAPGDWARTQHNLGVALFLLGERESSGLRLDEAAAAFGVALEERRLERDPLDWAATRIAFSNVLLSLGRREGGVSRLQEAADSLREVLIAIKSDKPSRLEHEARSALAQVEGLLSRRRSQGGQLLLVC